VCLINPLPHSWGEEEIFDKIIFNHEEHEEREDFEFDFQIPSTILMGRGSGEG
jgi:hypothetical protein